MDHFYHNIVGFADNCRGLYTSEVLRAQDGDIFVEVGVCLGRSLAFLAVEAINFCEETGKSITLYGIDHWNGDKSLWDNDQMMSLLGQQWRDKEKGNLMYNTCVKNLEPVIHIVKLIRKDSTESASDFRDESVAFAFIDADHERQAVKRDLLAWWPKIKPGGTLGGDDYHLAWPEVIVAVDEFVAEKNSQHAQLVLEELGEGTWRIRKP